MQTHSPATPFGRRPASLGLITSEIAVRRAVDQTRDAGSNQPRAVNKWHVFRALTEIRSRLALSDRTLGLLNALLTFHPETVLSLPQPAAEGVDEDGSCELVVFPSNRQLALRAHGMAEKTIRNHLSALVGAGLIIRRDSPNGKRYARQHRGGEGFSDAFGFDLTPLVARAAEFETLAETVREEEQRQRVLRERITLHRRDIAKFIALAAEEGLAGPWEALRQRFLALLTPLRQLRGADEIGPIEGALRDIRQEAAKALESWVIASENAGNDGIDGRQQSNSKTQQSSNLELTSKEEAATSEASAGERGGIETKSLPLPMIVSACPDIRDYGPGGSIDGWGDFDEAVRLVRPMIGISPDAWEQAREAFGARAAAVAVATILQRSIHSSEAMADAAGRMTVNGSPAIQSPGGYLRALTAKAAAGGFSLWPIVMALLGQRHKQRRRISREGQ
jgi:replication initiation protein RepC